MVATIADEQLLFGVRLKVIVCVLRSTNSQCSSRFDSNERRDDWAPALLLEAFETLTVSSGFFTFRDWRLS
jgi:hypothetical protein